MTTLTEAQQKVVQEAQRRIARNPWYNGLCIDELPTDKDCKENFADAVETLVGGTEIWDAPQVL